MRLVFKRLMSILLGFMILSLVSGCAQRKATGRKDQKGATQERSMSKDAQGKALRGEAIIQDNDTLREQYDAPKGKLTAILKTVYFDFDRSEIKSNYRPTLKNIATWMKDNKDISLLIEGHCDERGTNEYNLALGERRALSVRRYLISLGISPSRLHTLSYGEERPADRGHTEAAWEKNRRVEFLTSNE